MQPNFWTRWFAVAACAAMVWGGRPAESARAAELTLNVEDTPVNREARHLTSFAPIIKKASASVVNIYTSKTVRMGDPNLNPFFNDPSFRRFFGEEFDQQPQRRPRTRMEQSLGSGVVVSEDGYILTNNHVVEGADEIKVALANGQKEFTAKVVGTDPQTDVAVIKVEGQKLPALAIANSDNLEVGDIVLAIGNPFGVGQTVTMGIVSAKDRGGFGIVDYEDFIQTDASINPGNSGGALVDAEGRLVGINTAIISRTGGNQGIGFAVPINMARHILQRIVRDGKVVRGYLGVMIQPLTSELAEQFGIKTQEGALVAGVNPKTPADKAGLKEGDVVVEFDGKKVTDNRHLRLMVAQTAPGTEVALKLMRDGKEQKITVTLEELPSGGLARAGRGEGGAGGDALEGVTVADIDARARRQFELPASLRGALVTEVDENSASYVAGLRPGDIILEVNRKPVTNADEAVQLSGEVTGPRILLRVWSQGGTRYLVVDESKKPK